MPKTKQPAIEPIDLVATAAMIQQKLTLGQRFWKPLHDRMDL